MTIIKCLVSILCVLLCFCGEARTAKAEKWIVVTGPSSGRLVWAAFSLGSEHSDTGISEALVSPDLLINTLSDNLGIPFVSDDVTSCDLPTDVQSVSSSMLTKKQTIELLHFLKKHFHGTADSSGFELQVECPLQASCKPKATPLYVDASLVLSLRNKTKTGLTRMISLSNVILNNVIQVRTRAFDEKGVVAPEGLSESATYNDLTEYWKRFILAPLSVECNGVVYDEDLSCLIIDVKNSKYESLGKIAQLYWAGEILK